MTIPEEIKDLEIKLAATTEERERAWVLLEILKRYSSLNSMDTQPYIEALLVLAGRLNDTRYRAWGLYYRSRLHRLCGEYEEALITAQPALSLFIEQNDQLGIANSYNSIGMVYKKQGNYPEALVNFSASMRQHEAAGSRHGQAVSLGNIGAVYEDQGNYAEALKNYLAALKQSEEPGHDHIIGSSYNNIGLIHFKLGNYDESLKNYFAALKLVEGLGFGHSIAGCQVNIANSYIQLGDYPEALKYLYASLKIFEQNGDKHHIAACYSSIGSIYLLQGDHNEALKTLFASLALSEELGDRLGIAKSYENIGKVYQNHSKECETGSATRQGLLDQALEMELKALKMAEEIGAREVIRDTALAAHEIYKATGDFESALRYFVKGNNTEKEMLGEESQKQLNNLSFMHHLEQKERQIEIEQLRNVELKRERDRSEELLLNILPAEVAAELKETGGSEPRHFDEVTVMFTDFQNFTAFSEKLSAGDLVDELNSCFSAFDAIITRYNIEKIKTMGDGFIAASGLPVANPGHAGDMVRAAIEIRDFMLGRKKEMGDQTLDIRIGLHSGRVVAGIVGVKKFAYDIWGDTVNTASRMEQHGEPGRINISETTYELIKDTFSCWYRGEIEAKNKGKQKMYFVH